MNEQERQQLFSTMNRIMQERAQLHTQLETSLKEFAERLFNALEKALAELRTSGVPGIGKSRRLVHPAGNGLEGFQLFIEDWSIIFVPLLGFARPNTSDEARIPPYQFKEPCGRIGVFLTDDPQGSAFYDFIIFTDRSWFAWGYGWPKQQAEIESTDFEALALELVYSFVRDIYVTWNSRHETTLGKALDTKKRAYLYGLPGDEQMGS